MSEIDQDNEAAGKEERRQPERHRLEQDHPEPSRREALKKLATLAYVPPTLTLIGTLSDSAWAQLGSPPGPPNGMQQMR